MSEPTQAAASSSTALLWSSWGMSTVVSFGYAVLGTLTFNSLHRVYKAVPVIHYKRVLQGTMAAALMGPILTVGLNFVSLFILFYKTWRHAGTGYGYGFINAAYLHQAIFILLSSVVLLSDRDWLHELSEIGELWSSIDSTLYIASYYVGFVASGFYFAQFFLLLCVQGAVRQHHRKHRQWPGASSRIGSQDPLLPASEPGTPVPGGSQHGAWGPAQR
ncbi:hypothetical protein WJX73_000865 [Symbiochloris irregularis]|uniref:Uncharacterized protein n=1 Tax=Symbiochloris irregularis TaxID=706552 RepID=A0AAW1P0I9_9CHLO